MKIRRLLSLLLALALILPGAFAIPARAAGAGIGVDPAHIRVVVPLPKNREELKRMIREEIEYRGVSVIIPRRECIQTAKRHAAERMKTNKDA